MPLAAHTYAFRSWPLPAALDEIRALGFTRVELWAGHVGEDRNALRSEFDRRRLEPVAVSLGGFYDVSDQPERAIELAEFLGVSIVVACVAPSLLGAVAAAAADRATICVENHWDQPLATAHEVDSALAGEPDLRACVDTGHAILAGCAPETFVRRLGARVAHVHLKEARRPT